MTVRQTYHHGDLRNAILAEAEKVLESDGPDAVTLRGLARRLEVSHAAPGHHFPDRAALLEALATEGFRGLNQALTASQESTSDPLRTLAWAYVEYALDHPALFRLMFDSSIYHSANDECWELAEKSFTLMAGVAGTNSRASKTTLDPQALRLWSMMHGAATLYTDGALDTMFPGPRGRERFRRRFLESLALESGNEGR
jgi:AcrR family transcriptional regulator